MVAGFSLYAIWRGGQAQGTSSALADLENSTGGGIVLFLIFLGMLAYALWRVIDAIWDLDDHGDDGKGMAARIAVAVTGLIHLSIAAIAFSLLFAGGGSGGSSGSGSGGGGSSSLQSGVSTVMQWPGGRWIVGIIGLVVLGAAGYFFYKGWKETYRRYLSANRFTTNWNGALRAGLFAHGAVVAIIGANPRTILLGLSMIAGSPLWFFLIELIVFNVVLVIAIMQAAASGRRIARLIAQDRQ